MGSREPSNSQQATQQEYPVPLPASPVPVAAGTGVPDRRRAEQAEIDPALRGSLYQVVANRRLGYDTLVWQVPALGLTAQAFLFTTALNTSNGKPARLVSASLALVIALISMQLMSKHRYHEEIDSRLLQVVETDLNLDKLYGCTPHAPPSERAETIRMLAADYPINQVRSTWIQRRSSYRLWMYGLALFALAAAGIIVTAVVDLAPMLTGIAAVLR